MLKHISFFGILLVLIGACSLNAGSIVYNMPLRRSMLLYGLCEPQGKKTWASLVPFGFNRTHDQTSVGEVMGGLVGSLRDSAGKWWIDLTSALIYDNELSKNDTENGSFIERRAFGLDDFLITLGIDPFVESQAYCSFYGLVGIPTHRIKEDAPLEFPLLGTGRYSVGGGCDAEYEYLSSPHYGLSLFSNLRLVYQVGTQMPIAFEKNDTNERKLQPGYFADLLIGHGVRIGNHCIEIGYAPVIPFGFKREEGRQEVDIETRGNVRNNVYLSYAYAASIKDYPVLFTLGISRGWLHEDESKTLIGWLAASVAF